MEIKYSLKDPKLLKADPDYPALGPIGVYGFIQEEYSDLFVEQERPALASALPAANNSSVENEDTENKRVNFKEKICFLCGSNTPFRGNPEYPQYSSTKKMKSATSPNDK